MAACDVTKAQAQCAGRRSTDGQHASLWMSLLVLEASGCDGARRVLRLLRDVRWASECGPGCLLRRCLHCMETVVRASAFTSPSSYRRRCSSHTLLSRSPSPSPALHSVPKDVLSRAWRRVWTGDGARRRTLSATATPRCTPCGTPRCTPCGTPRCTPCSTPRGTPCGTPRVSFSLHNGGRRATWGPTSEEALSVAKAWGCIGDFRRRRASSFALSPSWTENDRDDSNEEREKTVVALAWGCLTPEPAPPEDGDRRASVGRRSGTPVSLSDKGLSVLLPLAEWAKEAHKHHCAGNKCYRRLTDGTIVARPCVGDDRSSPDPLSRARCNSI